jgi:hypothetical protein
MSSVGERRWALVKSGKTQNIVVSVDAPALGDLDLVIELVPGAPEEQTYSMPPFWGELPTEQLSDIGTPDAG